MDLSLSPKLLNQIFPFCFALDRDFNILFAGRSLLKISPSVLEKSFQEVFSIVRPRSANDNFDSIAEFAEQIFILQSCLHTEKLLFRGQMVFIGDLLFFLGSPWITDARDLGKFHLGLTDFALHDPITDLMQILSVKDNVALDIKMLNRQLEKSEKRYRELVELGSDMIFKLDPRGNLIYLNEVALRILGYDKSEILGANISDFISRDWHEFIVETFQDLSSEKQPDHEIETPLKTKSGEELWVRQHLQLIYKGDQVKEIRVFAKDVTERKKAEDNLIKARKVAEAAQEAEKNFLAQMSHEIRTPLNAIVGMSQLLTQTDPSEEQSQYLDVMLSATELLLGLINDVLDLARMESGKVQVVPSPIDLNQLLDNYLRTFQLQLAEKQVALIIEPIPNLHTYLLTDPTMLNQIFFNLLGNAVKFTEEGSIELRSILEHQEGQELRIRFSVIDTGIGIPEDKLDYIFGRFHQANEDVSVKYGGTGLGLAITQNLVRMLGGEITVRSVLGEGSIFEFVLPFVDTRVVLRERIQQGIFQTDSGLEHLRILVAEDNPMNTLYIRKLLEKLGNTPTFTADGKQAIEKAASEPFDLILMDVQMPVLDGITATRQIRAGNHTNRETPIIALSATTIKEKLAEATEAGMNAFLPKPFTPQQLIHKIQEVSFEMALAEKILLTDQASAPCLDENLLNEIYEGDPEYAAQMLHSFEQDILPDFFKLKAIIEEGNYELARQLAHKIKPSFSLVGLPFIQDEMSLLLELTEKRDEEAATLYESIFQQMDLLLPQVKAAFEKLTQG